MKTVKFETAKRLYDMGVRIESEKAYYANLKEDGELVLNKTMVQFGNLLIADSFEFIVDAPDAQELYDATPKLIEDGTEVSDNYNLVIEPQAKDDVCIYYSNKYHLYVDNSKEKELGIGISKGLSEGLAENIFWLIENKYVTVEQINKGLK